VVNHADTEHTTFDSNEEDLTETTILYLKRQFYIKYFNLNKINALHYF